MKRTDSELLAEAIGLLHFCFERKLRGSGTLMDDNGHICHWETKYRELLTECGLRLGEPEKRKQRKEKP